MTAAFDYQPEHRLPAEDWFDDTDGASATHEPELFEAQPFEAQPFEAQPFEPSEPELSEPDPFADDTVLRPLKHPSLRAELRAELRVELRAELGTELGTAAARPISGAMGQPARRSTPALPVPEGLQTVLPDGLRRGSTMAVTSSVSLLLTLLGMPSAQGAWAAMVGMPAISADAAAEAGIDLQRLAIINPPDTGWTPATWTTAVGALLDAVDIVVARPGGAHPIVPGLAASGSALAGSGISDGDARRLSARARTKDSILLLFGQRAANWPVLEVQLTAQHSTWHGIDNGHGRITARQLTVSASGKGRSSQPRTGQLWLPLQAPAAIPSGLAAPDTSHWPANRPLSQAG